MSFAMVMSASKPSASISARHLCIKNGETGRRKRGHSDPRRGAESQWPGQQHTDKPLILKDFRGFRGQYETVGFGGRSRIRTYDPLIKSQLLYQLSYAPGPAGGG